MSDLLQKVICTIGNSEQDGSNEMNFTLVDVHEGTQFDTLDLAIVALAQHPLESLFSPPKLQLVAPARFVAEHIHKYDKEPCSEQEFVNEIKQLRKHVASCTDKVFEKDSAEAVELVNVQKEVDRMGDYADDWRREYRRIYGRTVNLFETVLGTDKNDIEERRQRARDFAEAGLGTFLCSTTLADTFKQIQLRRGDPSVIAIYGHGGINDLVAPDGGYNHVNGTTFSQELLKSGLQPRAVVFVCCHAYNVALAAQSHWSANCSAPCLFIGPTTETPADDIFSGDAIAARYLHTYWTSTLLLRLNGHFSVSYSTLPPQDPRAPVTWSRLANTKMTAEQLSALFTVCLHDNYVLNNLYATTGAAGESNESVLQERQAMAIDGTHPAWAKLDILDSVRTSLQVPVSHAQVSEVYENEVKDDEEEQVQQVEEVTDSAI